MSLFSQKLFYCFVAVCLVLPCVPCLQATAWGQGGRKSSSPPSTRALDQAAEKAEMEYLNSLADLASQYEQAGDLDRASAMLKTILKLRPDAEPVKNRLKMFAESVFQENVKTIDLDSGAGWVSTGIFVTKDKPIRLEAEGTYKFSINDLLTADGFSGQDLIHGLVEGVPCGGLMAVVGKSGETTRNNRKAPKDLPKPMFVGTKSEITPKESGPLLLRVNVPEGAKCTGKIKVRISGNIQATGN